jgi:hypothetical protein
MTRTRDCDSHIGEGMLDYNIRDSFVSSISPKFYGWIGSGASSTIITQGTKQHILYFNQTGYNRGLTCTMRRHIFRF